MLPPYHVEITVLDRSPELNILVSSEDLDGWPLGNPWCGKLECADGKMNNILE